MNYQPQYLKKWTEAPNYLGMDLTDYYVVAEESEQSDSVDMSNYRVWHRLFPELEQHSFGGHMRFKALMIPKDSSLIEAIDEKKKSLEDYSVLDEEDLSDLEYEQWNEYWSNCGYIDCFEELLIAIPELKDDERVTSMDNKCVLTCDELGELIEDFANNFGYLDDFSIGFNFSEYEKELLLKRLEGILSRTEEN
ncbi:MAG: hypothetical protein PX635_19200 [Nostocales cyanobacterium LE14-WE12]|jgi:hypothetical protein|nr:hypothetical protein [Nostocales cyanobacterium LE14-WE12]